MKSFRQFVEEAELTVSQKRAIALRDKEKEGVAKFQGRRQSEKDKGLMLRDKARAEIDAGLEKLRNKKNNRNAVADVASDVGRTAKGTVKNAAKLAKSAAKGARNIVRGIKRK